MTEVVNCSFHIECNDAELVRKYTKFYVQEIQHFLDENDLEALVTGYRNDNNYIPYIQWKEND